MAQLPHYDWYDWVNCKK